LLDVTLLLVKRQEKFFLAVKTTLELFAWLVFLVTALMRSVELLSLVMRLHKRGWCGKLAVVKSVFCGPKNLLLRENAIVLDWKLLSTWNWRRERHGKGKGELFG
jgi:hypothetical protein